MVKLTDPQRRALTFVRDAHRLGLMARDLARLMWPDSKGWNGYGHGAGRGSGIITGRNIQMNAGALLWRLLDKGLVWRKENYSYVITDAGRRALEESPS